MTDNGLVPNIKAVREKLLDLPPTPFYAALVVLLDQALEQLDELSGIEKRPVDPPSRLVTKGKLVLDVRLVTQWYPPGIAKAGTTTPGNLTVNLWADGEQVLWPISDDVSVPLIIDKDGHVIHDVNAMIREACDTAGSVIGMLKATRP
jgi:hypothetical protein